MADDQQQEEYVVAIDTRTKKPVARKRRLAEANGEQIVQGGFSSESEAAAAIRSPSPVDQAADQADAQASLPNLDRRVWDYNPSAPSPNLNKSEMRKRLEEIAFQNQQNQPPVGTVTPSASAALVDQGRSRESVRRGMQPDMVYNMDDKVWEPNIGDGDRPPARSRQTVGAGNTSNAIPMTEGVYDGTWAQGRLTPEQHMRVISGEMTPEAAVQMMTNDSYGADYERMLADIYGSYVPLYSMANAGNVPTDEAMILGQGGDMTLGWTNSDRAEANVDYGQLWDNQYSPEYMDFMSTVPKSSEEEYKMIQQNVAALSTYTTPEAASIVSARVDDAYTDYIASGYTGTFTQYLRDIGADQWL